MHVIHIQYVLLLTILTDYMITLHLWDTGSVGIPIDNQCGLSMLSLNNSGTALDA